MNGDERGRAGGIDCQARTVKIEGVGNTVRKDAERGAGHKIGIGGRQIANGSIGVFHRGRADIDAHLGATQPLLREPRILERLSGKFKEKPLLRIDLGRFPRRNAEKLRVETIDFVQQTGSPRIALPRFAVDQ